MTSFIAVHLALTAVSLALGTIIGVLGIRALRAQRRVGLRVGDESARLASSR